VISDSLTESVPKGGFRRWNQEKAGRNRATVTDTGTDREPGLAVKVPGRRVLQWI